MHSVGHSSANDSDNLLLRKAEKEIQPGACTELQKVLLETLKQTLLVLSVNLSGLPKRFITLVEAFSGFS